MSSLGFWEITLILLIFLAIFGASRLPGIGKALGKAVSEFRKAAEKRGDNGSDKKERH